MEGTEKAVHEEELTGGGVNHVVRVEDTVRRPARRWTPVVHALLEAVLVETARARLEHLVAHMRAEAEAGHEAFAAHVAEGHDVLYLTGHAHLAAS